MKGKNSTSTVRGISKLVLAIAITSTLLAVDCSGHVAKQRLAILKESILHCTSSYQFDFRTIETLQVGIEDTTITASADVHAYWFGIVSNPEFREYLAEQGITPQEFQKSVSDCQEKYLERVGFFGGQYQIAPTGPTAADLVGSWSLVVGPIPKDVAFSANGEVALFIAGQGQFFGVWRYAHPWLGMQYPGRSPTRYFLEWTADRQSFCVKYYPSGPCLEQYLRTG